LLSWALAHLLRTEHPRNTVRQLFFKVAEYLDFDSFFLYLRDPETSALTLYALGGVPPASEKDFLSCPFTALVTAETHKILLLDSVQKHPEPSYAVLKKAGVSAAVAIPLFAEGRNLGLLCFTTWSRESVPTEETDVLTTIGQYLATALDREQARHLLQKAKEQLSEHAQLLEEKVQERTSRLQETISELETFSYTLAHDLKAPVRGMTGFCDVLLEDYRDQLSPGAANVVTKLARASRRMETLTRDLLEFSKISRQEINLERVEIEPLLDDLIGLRLPEVRKAITIESPLHPVLAQKALLQQVLSNLVDNAIKFVPANSDPKVRICTEIVAQSSPNTRLGPLLFSSVGKKSGRSVSEEGKPNNRVRVWIKDEGIGIHHEAHQKIFGIFERGVSSPAYEGTGIGLAIVARAMQRMGGTCGVESEPGKGSQFWIELPAA
jgi:signal transduction histidine kinase